jgi:hypothetical protein
MVPASGHSLLRMLVLGQFDRCIARAKEEYVVSRKPASNGKVKRLDIEIAQLREMGGVKRDMMR